MTIVNFLLIKFQFSTVTTVSRSHLLPLWYISVDQCVCYHNKSVAVVVMNLNPAVHVSLKVKSIGKTLYVDGESRETVF